MPKKPQPEKQIKETPQGVSRRQMLVGAGIGAAGLVAGGAVGYAAPKRKPPSPPVPEVWIGRNLAECTGCRLCQVACSVEKEGKIQPSIARMSVFQFFPGVEFPVACYQCGDEAKCVEVCPEQSMSVDTSNGLNIIRTDLTTCLRTARGGDCTLCQDECPAGVGAVRFHPTTSEPLICDLCDGDVPCVDACPAGTITLRGIKMAAIESEQIAAGLAEAYKVPDPDLMPQRPQRPPQQPVDS